MGRHGSGSNRGIEFTDEATAVRAKPSHLQVGIQIAEVLTYPRRNLHQWQWTHIIHSSFARLSAVPSQRHRHSAQSFPKLSSGQRRDPDQACSLSTIRPVCQSTLEIQDTGESMEASQHSGPPTRIRLKVYSE